MASQVYCQLHGPQGGQAFGLSCTEGTWGELVDGNSLSLGDVMAGMVVNQIQGSYNAGTGLVRVYNTQTKQVKMLALLPIVTEERVQYLERPFTVDQFDVLQAMTQAVA